jgi:Co/Zn/Cd efflux system component
MNIFILIEFFSFFFRQKNIVFLSISVRTLFFWPDCLISITREVINLLLAEKMFKSALNVALFEQQKMGIGHKGLIRNLKPNSSIQISDVWQLNDGDFITITNRFLNDKRFAAS